MNNNNKFYPIYQLKTEKFNFKDPPRDPEILTTHMIEFMCIKSMYGLSANDIKIPYSVFVFGDPKNKDSVIECFNPKLLHISKELEKSVELSHDHPELLLKIYRPETIKVDYQDRYGKINNHIYSGLTARIWLHEYDSLCGVDFRIRSSKLTLNRAIKKRNKLNAKRNKKTYKHHF